MKYFVAFSILIFMASFATAQQYDTVFIEKDSIDENNQIYRPGNFYLYNYEVIQGGQRQKLKANASRDFELAPVDENFHGIQHIKLTVKGTMPKERANPDQTRVAYFCEPDAKSFSATGLVENTENLWLHPIRDGFFRSLETAPFPYVQLPLQVGKSWQDAMKIGSHWCNPIWGEWEGNLLLNYTYTISGKETTETPVGTYDCWVIDATATSELGETKLKSYFHEQLGFLRYEYQLLNGLKVNLWLAKLGVSPGKAVSPFQELMDQE